MDRVNILQRVGQGLQEVLGVEVDDGAVEEGVNGVKLFDVS